MFLMIYNLIVFIFIYFIRSFEFLQLWLVASRLSRLNRFNAKHDEYLKILHLDGKVEHRMGPCTLALNTLVYSAISIEKCYCLDANQAILVYKREDDGSSNEKKKELSKYKLTITKGPGIFMIQPDEWYVKTFLKFLVFFWVN